MRAQGTETIAMHRYTMKPETQDGRRLRRYERAGSSSVSLLGCGGNVGSSFAGNTIRAIILALYSLRPYASDSDSFEIGSRVSGANPGIFFLLLSSDSIC